VDLLLAVEVSDTTLGHDLEEKRLRYAAAGIPAYWVADIVGQTLHVFADPRDGDYLRHEVVTDLDAVIPLPAAPPGCPSALGRSSSMRRPRRALGGRSSPRT
jgi:hypothetical protein